MFRRPLIWIAVVLALGVFIVNKKEAGHRFAGWITPPFLRTEMEHSGETFREEMLEGKVEWLEEEDDENGGAKVTMTLRCPRNTAGKVRVHLKETTREELPEIGAAVQVTGDLFLYEKARNPGAFDVRGYYDSVGCYLAMTHAKVRVLNRPRTGVRHALWLFCRRLSDAVCVHTDKETAGYLNSVLFREDSGLADHARSTFQNLNLLRLLKLTGAGLLLVGNGIHELVRKRFRSRLAVAVLSFLPVFLYACMTGFTPTARRVLIVFAVRLMAPVFKRRFDLASAAAFMLILLILDTPCSILNTAVLFYLAAAVSAGIVVPTYRRLLKNYRKITVPMLYTLCGQCFFLPLLLYGNYSFSPYGMLLAILFSMGTGLIAVTGLLGASIGVLCGKNSLSAFFFGTGHYLYRFQLAAAETAEKLPCAQILRGCPSMRSVIGYYGLLLVIELIAEYVLLKQRSVPERDELRIGRRGEAVLVLLFLGMLFFGVVFLKAPPPPADGAEIIMLDVGQGDCFLIRTKDTGNYVVDCGSSSMENVGTEVLFPALRYYGIRRLDGIFLSHRDEDHVNGILPETAMEVLLDTVPVTRLYLTDAADFENYGLPPGAPEICCIGAGDSLNAGSTSFRVLHPEHGSPLTGNDASMVLLFSTPSFSMLFTGDIPEEQERNLPPVHADVLKAAHHGSAYSTSAAFLARTSPAYALVSCGKNNVYGHPAPAFLDRLREAKTRVYRTDEEGAVILNGSRKGIHVMCFLRKPLLALVLPCPP